MELTLTVSIEETNALLKILGELPTNSGAYPLLVKIQTQAQAEVERQQNETPELSEVA